MTLGGVRQTAIVTNDSAALELVSAGHLNAPEGYVFSDPSRSHRFVFVDQATKEIDPANAWRVG